MFLLLFFFLLFFLLFLDDFLPFLHLHFLACFLSFLQSESLLDELLLEELLESDEEELDELEEEDEEEFEELELSEEELDDLELLELEDEEEEELELDLALVSARAPPSEVSLKSALTSARRRTGSSSVIGKLLSYQAAAWAKEAIFSSTSSSWDLAVILIA